MKIIIAAVLALAAAACPPCSAQSLDSAFFGGVDMVRLRSNEQKSLYRPAPASSVERAGWAPAARTSRKRKGASDALTRLLANLALRGAYEPAQPRTQTPANFSFEDIRGSTAAARPVAFPAYTVAVIGPVDAGNVFHPSLVEFSSETWTPAAAGSWRIDSLTVALRLVPKTAVTKAARASMTLMPDGAVLPLSEKELKPADPAALKTAAALTQRFQDFVPKKDGAGRENDK